MSHVLLVKLTSMGDLIQLLPALSDAHAQRPELRFDWVADAAFAEIPSWHPAVDRVIPSAHRHWRRHQADFIFGGSGRAWLRRLRERPYTRIIDAQGSWKSAVIARLARGPSAGLDGNSVREPGAQWLYGTRHFVAREQFAITRWRQLLAAVLDYPVPTSAPDFGLAGRAWPEPPIAVAAPILTFVANATWPTKHWPDAHWRELIAHAIGSGYQVVLPWGSARERERAETLARAQSGTWVSPRASLGEIAALLSRSAAVVSVDTGLAHLGAALGRPTLTLYGPTDPRLIAATGPRALQLPAAGYPCIPCRRRECRVAGYRGPAARCMQNLTPALVWARLQALLAA
ncbi:MAG: lipopolysaccharide heptosyltransferase I [Porticoccaceae bacterium]